MSPFKGLTPKDVVKVQSVYPDLREIQTATQVPWQLLAGVWYRESFSVASPATPGGPWQFDPPPSRITMMGLMAKYSRTTPEFRLMIATKGIEDFKAGGYIAACFLQEKVKGKLALNAPDAVVKDAVWGYNGREYGSADKSPYVVNGLDEDHYPMHLHGTIPDGHGGRKVVDTQDIRPGAFTIYRQLKELFP